MSSLIEREDSGRLGRAWSKFTRGAGHIWRKWLRFWEFCGAIGTIALGAMFALPGAAGATALLFEATTRGNLGEAGYGVACAFLGVGGGVMIAEGVGDLKAWWRTR